MKCHSKYRAVSQSKRPKLVFVSLSNTNQGNSRAQLDPFCSHSQDQLKISLVNGLSQRYSSVRHAFHYPDLIAF